MPAGPTWHLVVLDLMHVTDKTEIDAMLAMKTWAIVGLGDNPSRDAYGIAQLLISRGQRIVPVHPLARSVHGQKAYARLADIPFPVDVVDIFVNSSVADGIVDEAIAIGAKGVWFQLGVNNPEAAQRVKDAGLLVAVDSCPGIEYLRIPKLA